MGRKTWDSIPTKPLPGRVSIVVTNQTNLIKEGKDIKVVSSLHNGIEYARSQGEQELMIIGGGEIYQQAMPLVNKMYFTRVHTTINDGDVFFPSSLINWPQWILVESEKHEKDEKNEFDFTIETYVRK